MQQTFLGEVASKLYEQYGDEISSLTIVLPSRRARLFFSDEISRLIDHPIWQPEYISMDDIMRQAASYETGEKVRIITELYKVYSQYHEESFDKFYFWGEMLLSDFDLIDKYMIDADTLFRNLCDIKELEADLSYLTPEMRKIIHAFWSNFADEASLSDEKRKFLAVWLSLAPIYHRFKARLHELGFAYSGMLYRSAADNIANGQCEPDLERSYVFVGFNALSECEKRMLKHLNLNAKSCEFYWDYDSYYVDNTEQEAGKFLRENISTLKPKVEITHDNFLNINKKLSAISTISNVTQCKYVNTLLREISPSLEFDKQTAIVLTDESLLIPLLHSLPQELSNNINITMGYPLRQTTAYSFIERVIELQKNARKNKDGETTFYHVDAMGLLSHPYLTERESEKCEKLRKEILSGRYIRINSKIFSDSEFLSAIFSTTDNWNTLSKWLLEIIDIIISTPTDKNETNKLQLSYLTILSEQITELSNCLNKCEIDITTSTFTSLLKRHLQTIRIPFSGEPLRGLQIMGILETRNIDFKNVIILSMNDDNFPGNLMGAPSFIPYNLKAAYGMPTPEHHEGVNAYYFYRLIQRAERVDMLYCSHSDEKTTGERSRYIHQLHYESPYPIRQINFGVDVAAATAKKITIEKTGRTKEKLLEYITEDNPRLMSPAALAPYITCPLKFYFASIAKLKTTEELSEDVDSPMFGNILHNAMQILYKEIENIANPAEELKLILKGDHIERAVTDAINRNFLKDKNATQEEYTGNLVLVKDMVTKYIRQGIIPYDIAHNNFALKHREEKITLRHDIGDGRRVLLGGYADRIDSMDDGTIRVVDYKTGYRHLEFNGIDSLFEGKNRAAFSNLTQTMLYSMVLKHNFLRNVTPELYFVRYMQNKDYNPRLIDTSDNHREVDYITYAEEFEQHINEKLQELFNMDIPFEQCPEEESKEMCAMCDFKTLCKR